MSVFIGLSKGLKSYGKVVYLFAICPLVGYIVFTIKVIGLLPLETFQYWIKSTNWLNFFYNGDVSNIFSDSFRNFLNFFLKNTKYLFLFLNFSRGFVPQGNAFSHGVF